MENKLTPELLEKAKQTKSPEELIALAKENGAELMEEEANTYFAKINKSGELADDELDNVAGGGCVQEAVGSAYDAARDAYDTARGAIDDLRGDSLGSVIDVLKKGGTAIGSNTGTNNK